MNRKRCPCGSGLTYAEDCGRLHDGAAVAATAEQLMRSRYSAFAVGDAGYLLTTWHPAARPTSLHLDGHVRWNGLDMLATAGGTRFSLEGAAEVCTHYLDTGRAGAQHEDSRFLRDGGQWRFLDGASLP